MPAPLDCPGIECWQALFDNTVPPDQREHFEQHLESCPACQDRLHRAKGSAEPLLTLIRRVGDPTLAPADPTLDQLLEHLYEVKGPDGTAPAEPPDLYFLRPSDRPDLLGTLGDYEVQEVIGQGGMGIVLKAFEPALHRLVAIKVLSPALAGSANARRRFTREAQAAAAVCHDHIVTVHGVHEADGLPYLVMQYVAGESLQARLDRNGPLELVDIVRIGLQTASGLAAAHAQGLIHRDIKPANLLLEDGLAKVKITDFGLARMVDDVRLTQNGVVAGTPEYMAPEQARGEVIDHRADLFSLGSVLYAMSTGRPPFRGSTPLALLHQVNEQEPVPVRSLNPDMPGWLEALILRLLRKDPQQRVQSAAEIAALLEGYLAHLQQPMVNAPELPPLPSSSEKGTKVEDQQEQSANRFLCGLGSHAHRVWVPMLVLLAVLGLWIGLRFPGDAGPTKEAQEAPKIQPAGGHAAFDFRAGIATFPALSLHGPDLETAATTDSQGLRITLPAGRGDVNPVGLEMAHRLRGNFDILLGYELLAVGEPLPEYGAGVRIQVWFDTPSSPSVVLSRFRKPTGESFGAHKIIKDPAGKDLYLNSKHARATRTKGKLRLLRTGSQLQYLVADEGQDFKIIQSLEIGTDDVQKLRVDCSTMSTPIALDVRLTELVLDADQFPDGMPAARPAPVSAEVPPEPGKKGWLGAAVLILGLLLVLALAEWFFGRQHQRAEPKAVARLAGSFRRRLALAALVLVVVLGLGVGLLLYFTGSGSGSSQQAQAANEPGGSGRRLRGHTGPVHDVRFTPDGRLVSVSGWPQGDRTVRVWDPATGKELGRVSTSAQVQALDLTPDGRFALAGLGNGAILHLDLQTSRVVKSLQGHSGAVGWVAFAPDGKHAFSTSSDGTARLWDVEEGKEQARFRVKDKRARGGAILSEGRQLLTGDGGGLLQLWDVATKQEVKQIDLDPPGFIDSLSLSRDGRQALVAGQGGVRLCDLETGKVVRQLQAESEEVHHAVLSPDGRWLLAGGFDGVVRLWDFQSGQLLRTLGSHNGFVFSVAFSPDGRLAASAGGGENNGGNFVAGTDHDIRLWDLTKMSADAALPAQSPAKGWLAATAILFVVVALSLFGMWWYLRQGRWAEKTPPPARDKQAKASAASPAIAVQCSSCGQKLKARGELAGKKVKCSQCGQAVVVPGIKAANSGSTS